MYDLVIVGAGVAGLMAAGTAAGRGLRVVLLEKMEKPGRKLRITGKGRCNVTNARPQEEFLEKIRNGREFFLPAFEAFDNRQTAAFLEQIGVPLVTERGDRIFPASGRAWDVADALVRWVQQAGAEIRCHTPVSGLLVTDGVVEGVELADGETIKGRNVLLTTGGVSYPATGSTGEGHEIAYRAGHAIEPLRPALVPLETEPVAGLKGLALRNVALSLLVDGREAEDRFGEMEFTSDGVLGGAIVLQLSRTAVDALTDGHRAELSLDLKPALSPEKLRARILREREALTQATVRVLLQKLIPSQLHALLAQRAEIPLKMSLARFTDQDAERLAGALKDLRMEVTDYRPFTEAIVTAGGVELSEVDPGTMASRLVSGLWFAGELLDLDADTGGYNIQIALSTGRLAGMKVK